MSFLHPVLQQSMDSSVLTTVLGQVSLFIGQPLGKGLSSLISKMGTALQCSVKLNRITAIKLLAQNKSFKVVLMIHYYDQ